MFLLQRAEQRLRAFGLAGVAAQRAHQQRQRGADGGRGLGGIDAQLLRDLLDRCALELRGEVVGEGGHRACPWEVRDGHPTTTMLRGRQSRAGPSIRRPQSSTSPCCRRRSIRSEEHTSELQSLMRISYAVFCLKKKNYNTTLTET